MSCPDCFRGYIRTDAKPTGRKTTIHGLPTYVAEPPSGQQPKGVIVIVPDAFGWEFVNNQLLADTYASEGQFLVYLPDFMNGFSAPTWMIQTFDDVMKTGSVWAWMRKPYDVAVAIYGFVPFSIYNRYGVSMPRVEAFISGVRAHEALHLPIGAAGFCWGGKHGLNLADGVKQVNGQPLADAVFIAHPSNLSVPAEFEKATKPVSLAIGDKDFVMSMAEAKTAETVLKKTGVVELNEVVFYPGAGHGFSIRAEVGNEKVVEQSRAAEKQAINFFKKAFEGVKY